MKHRPTDSTENVYSVERKCNPNEKAICGECNQQMCFECSDCWNDVWMHHACAEKLEQQSNTYNNN